jgi:hypothetical protein
LRFHGFRVFGQVSFGNDVQFKFMLVYFNNSSTYDDVKNNLLSNIIGGFILATRSEIRFFTFQNLNKPNVLEMPADDSILDMYLISPNHVAVAFESQKCINIYNIHDNKLVEQIQLNGTIKKMQCNQRRGYIVSFDKMAKKSIFLALLYAETNEVDVYKVNTTNLTDLNEVDMLINKQNDNLSLEQVYKLSPLGTTPGYKVGLLANQSILFRTRKTFIMLFKVNSIGFRKSDHVAHKEIVLLVSLKNGDLIQIQLDSRPPGHRPPPDGDPQTKPYELNYFRLKERYTKNAVQLLESLEGVHLFFDKKASKLYVYKLTRTGLFVINIPGTFEDGFFMRDYKVAGVVNGNLHVYLIVYDEDGSNKENSLVAEKAPARPVSRARSASNPPLVVRKHYFYVVKLMEFNYHFDTLTAHYVAGKHEMFDLIVVILFEFDLISDL